jgi:non-heme chloroperoxidase
MKSGDSIAGMSRRHFLSAAALSVAATLVPHPGLAALSKGRPQVPSSNAEDGMKSFLAKDGTTIRYKDWGIGQPVVFSHGWPLNADAWDAQMLYLGARGFRVIAHDRRGHGRSEQTSNGNEMDTYADDLAALFEVLNLTDAVMVGHSTGGGEVARYIGRHGTKRVAKAVLISSVPPVMLKSQTNPDGLPISVFDGIRSGVAEGRSQFYLDLSLPFFGYNRPGAKISEGIREDFWCQGMQGGIKGQYDCVKALSETDFTADLRKINVPTLVMHGDDDQIVPFPDSGAKTATIVKNATLKVYPGFPHGMPISHADVINPDLLAFIKA